MNYKWYESEETFKNHGISAMNMSELTRAALMRCFFQDDEDHSDHVAVEGITRNFGLHPVRLEENRELVERLCGMLPSNFKEHVGGGWSFTQMPFTYDEEQWGEQVNAQELLVMAVGLGIMAYQIPRHMWLMFPGGVPYVVIRNTTKKYVRSLTNENHFCVKDQILELEFRFESNGVVHVWTGETDVPIEYADSNEFARNFEVLLNYKPENSEEGSEE